MRYKNFTELIDQNIKNNPQEVVFLLGTDCIQTITWKFFYDEINQRVHTLQQDSHSCIGILCEHTLACIAEIFASVIANKQTVLLDANVPFEQLQKQISTSNVDQLWGSHEKKDEFSLCNGCKEGKGKILFFTSGTSSFAKAVVLTDDTLLQSAWNGGNLLPLTPKDVLLDILPVNHVFGFVCGLLWGMTMHTPVALSRGMRHYIDDCSFFHPTVIPLVPLQLGFFLQHKLFNPELKMILIGAGDCPTSYFIGAQNKGIQVHFGYGLSETSSGVALSLGDDPLAMTVCKEDTITIDEDGEILIQAPTCMMQGYYLQPQETNNVLVDGVLHSGDLGFFDDHHLLHVTGRKKEILVLLDGTKIFLPEYERILKDTLHTEELVVALQNHVPVLVVDETERTEADILDSLDDWNHNLPRGQQIHSVINLHHPFSHTASGKIQRWIIQKEVNELC